jgi:hypothetical protein
MAFVSVSFFVAGGSAQSSLLSPSVGPSPASFAQVFEAQTTGESPKYYLIFFILKKLIISFLLSSFIRK